MALVMYDNEKKNDEEKLHGIVPQHYFAYRVFKFLRYIIIAAVCIGLAVFGVGFIDNPILKQFSTSPVYGFTLFFCIVIIAICGLLSGLIYLIWLRKPPFDVWVFEFAEKRLGTDVIYYNSRCLYIQYDRASTKEVDKKDFVTEMSDQSEHYSYYYIDTFIDLGVIQVECEKRAPIPERASFSPEDDPMWNMIPVGLTVNNANKSISPIGWYLNDQNKSDTVIETAPSVSFLIAGGPLALDTIIPTTKGYKTMETIEVGDEVFDINNKPVKVLGKSEVFNNAKNYQLILKNNSDIKKISCTEDHRFPVITNNNYLDVQCKDININDEILGNFYNYTVISKKNIQNISTQCILIDSKEHEFLITDKIEDDWEGGQEYSYPAVYSRNTGCHAIGEEILIRNNLITDIKDI